jgi:hypothetical protein
MLLPQDKLVKKDKFALMLNNTFINNQKGIKAELLEEKIGSKCY